MRNSRFLFWWYEIRYEPAWQLAILVGLISLLLIIASAAGLPQWMVRAQKAAEAACIADGGRMVFGRDQRGNPIPVCLRD